MRTIEEALGGRCWLYIYLKGGGKAWLLNDTRASLDTIALWRKWLEKKDTPFWFNADVFAVDPHEIAAMQVAPYSDEPSPQERTAAAVEKMVADATRGDEWR